MSRCDFCGTPTPTWLHPAPLQVIAGPGLCMHSIQGWAACDECSALVEKKDLERLVIRLADQAPDDTGWKQRHPSALAGFKLQLFNVYLEILGALSPRQPWVGPAEPMQIQHPESN